MYNLITLERWIGVHGFQIRVVRSFDYAPIEHNALEFHNPNERVSCDGVIIARNYGKVVYMTRAGKLEWMGEDEDWFSSRPCPEKLAIRDFFLSVHYIGKLRKMIVRKDCTWQQLIDVANPF